MTTDSSSNGVVQATRPPTPLSAAIHIPLCKELLFKAQEQKEKNRGKSYALSTLSLKSVAHHEKGLRIFNHDSLTGSVFLKPLKAHMCSAHIGESVSDSFRTLIQTIAADRGPYGAVSGEQTPTDR